MKLWIWLCLTLTLSTLSFQTALANDPSRCEILYIQKQFESAFPVCERDAKNGNSDAQYFTGMMYAYGRGAGKSYTEAFHWWGKAANQGHIDAQYNLGVAYENALGVNKSHSDAIKWWHKAADQGNAAAQYIVGMEYIRTQKLQDAIKWLSSAAKARYKKAEDALFDLATLTKEAAKPWNKLHPEKYVVGRGNENYSYFDSTQIRDTPNGIATWITHQDRKDLSNKGVVSILVKCDESLLRTLSTTVYMGDSVQTFHPEKTAYTIPRPDSSGSNMMDKVCKSKNSVSKSEKDKSRISFGTGWSISGSYVVTNNHVIAGHKKFTLLRTDGVEVPATVVMRDEANDLALLKIQDSSKIPPALRLASMPARIGDKVFTIGYPHPTTMGAKPKLTDGIVSAVTGIKDDPRTYQISVPLQAGNSGGPLLNMDGEVVGIVTAKLSAVKMFNWTGDLPQNVNYAVKSPYLSVLLSTTPKGKKGAQFLSKIMHHWLILRKPSKILS